MQAEEIVRAEMLTPDVMETEGDEADAETEMSATHEYLQMVEQLRRELAEGTAIEEAEYQKKVDNS